MSSSHERRTKRIKLGKPGDPAKPVTLGGWINALVIGIAGTVFWMCVWSAMTGRFLWGLLPKSQRKDDYQ